MAQRPPPAVMLLTIAVLFLASLNQGGASTSRFLAGLGAKNKKCSSDPKVCNMPGTGGQTCCRHRCVDVSNDAFNCGHCGKICKFTDTCCKGKCVETTYDRRNCGGCGNHCSPGIKCLYGLCQYA